MRRVSEQENVFFFFHFFLRDAAIVHGVVSRVPVYDTSKDSKLHMFFINSVRLSINSVRLFYK